MSYSSSRMYGMITSFQAFCKPHAPPSPTTISHAPSSCWYDGRWRIGRENEMTQRKVIKHLAPSVKTFDTVKNYGIEHLVDDTKYCDDRQLKRNLRE